jgi:hypothetical protein
VSEPSRTAAVSRSVCPFPHSVAVPQTLALSCPPSVIMGHRMHADGSATTVLGVPRERGREARAQLTSAEEQSSWSHTVQVGQPMSSRAAFGQFPLIEVIQSQIKDCSNPEISHRSNPPIPLLSYSVCV